MKIASSHHKAVSLLILLTLATSGLCMTSEYRVWRTPSGSQVKARIQSFDGEYLHLETEAGKDIKIKLELLTAHDQKIVNNLRFNGQVPHTAQMADSRGSNPDRMLMPSYNQADFVRGNTSCGPNAFANFVLWWDRIGVFDIPKGETEQEKAEWLHKELVKHFEARKGTNSKNMMEGIATFLKQYPSKKYTFDIERSYPLSIQTLQSNTHGLSACILNVSTHFRGRLDKQRGHYLSLVTMSDRGGFMVHTWGKIFRGQLVPRPSKSSKTKEGETAVFYELSLLPDKNSQILRQKENLWVLDPKQGDSLVVVTPRRRH